MRKSFDSDLAAAEKDAPQVASDLEALKARVATLIDEQCAPAIKAGMESGDAATITSQRLYKKDCAPAFPPIVEDLKAKSSQIANDVDKQDDALTEVTKGAIAATFMLIVAGLAAVMVGSFFAIRSWLVSPMKGLSSVMDRLARGELQARVEGEDRRDELGGMARAVQVFKDAGLEKQRLEAEATAQRSMSEEERLRS
jgi:methyl-accepting chemotaxis protein